MIVKLKDAQYEAKHYFIPFCDGLRLKEIITGPRCTLSRNRLLEAVTQEDRKVMIIKGRLAFSSFKVVQNRTAKILNNRSEEEK